MTKGSYLGGSTMWDGRQSAPVEYAVPSYQSEFSARLLGSDDPAVAKFGEAVLRLEGEVFHQIKRLRESENSADFFKNRYHEKLLELNEQLAEAYKLGDDPEAHAKEIRAFTKRMAKGR